jgi:hypothetical protein
MGFYLGDYFPPLPMSTGFACAFERVLVATGRDVHPRFS